VRAKPRVHDWSAKRSQFELREEERVSAIIYRVMDQWPGKEVSIWATARLAPMVQCRIEDNFMTNGTPPHVVLDLLRHHRSSAIRATRPHPPPLPINRQVNQGPIYPWSGRTPSPPYAGSSQDSAASSPVSDHVFGGMLTSQVFQQQVSEVERLPEPFEELRSLSPSEESLPAAQ
jgi:hypothetical protein